MDLEGKLGLTLLIDALIIFGVIGRLAAVQIGQLLRVAAGLRELLAAEQELIRGEVAELARQQARLERNLAPVRRVLRFGAALLYRL